MAHPSTKADHEMARRKICCACGKRPKEIRQLTSANYVNVKKYLNENFDINDPHFPTGICNTCRLFLSQHSKGDTSKSLPEMPDYASIILFKDLRGHENRTCNCYICITARSRNPPYHSTPAKGRGMKRSISPTIKFGLMAAQEEVKIPMLQNPKKHPKDIFKICSECHKK